MTEIDFILIRLWNMMAKLELVDNKKKYSPHRLIIMRERMFCPSRSYTKYKPIKNREDWNE